MAALTGFDHLYLEDSYFLGCGVNGEDLELRALFALTRDHASYEPPSNGEEHCYREGLIRVSGCKPLNIRGGAGPSILRDPGGPLDLGSIEVSADATSYGITTEWFAMRFEAESVKVTLRS